ncbi:8d51ae04-a27f-4779-9a09-9a9d47a223f1 [Sclerotinia trifoliorum]|uniref:8d51ae04-a27f-4779-9a09-9a9d47a223f1 n=1 Tax=Sclerotinia trifoliorum TaxID=28548 RepID=A0A8H2VV45_9HELO|nr:8d51ae04-a27f-4779-9a09-9a9d47a223f1 [Sclerotinia trifoliorum]
MKPNIQAESGKYAFITSTPLHSAKEDRETRTLVRKHVMRPFMKQNRPKKANGLKKIVPRVAVGASQRQPLIPTTNEDGAERDYRYGATLMAPLGNGRVNPFQAWPIKMNMQEHELVHYIWDSSQGVQPFRDVWFPLAISDPAAMNVVLANASLHINYLRGNKKESRDAMMYHLSAVRSVNRRLPNFAVEQSEGILGAILGFMCHDQILFNPKTWKIHRAGFCKILALRGGLSTIEHIQSLRLSLFWIEINMASDLDVAPLFPPPLQYLTNPYLPKYQAAGEVHFSSVCAYSNISLFLSANMLDVMRQLSILAVTMIREKGKKNPYSKKRLLRGDQGFAGLCIYPILSKLLTIQNQIHNKTEELCRIGGLLFIAQARKWCGVTHLLTKVLMAKLRRLLKIECNVWDARVKKLRLWTLVMAGCTAATDDERAWVIEALKRDVSHWTELENVKNMWWVDELSQAGLLNIEEAIHSFQEKDS